MERDRFDSIEEMSKAGGSCGLSDLRKEKTFNENINIRDKLKIDETDIFDEPDFFLTGSRAWGMEHEDSDYDYICNKAMFEKTIKRLEHHKLKYVKHDYFSSLYTTGQDGLFNIIALDPHEYDCWVFATRALKGMVAEGVLTHENFTGKDKVYGLFGILKAMERLL